MCQVNDKAKILIPTACTHFCLICLKLKTKNRDKTGIYIYYFIVLEVQKKRKETTIQHKKQRKLSIK